MKVVPAALVAGIALLAAPVASAERPHYVPAYVPPGLHLLQAQRTEPGSTNIGYVHAKYGDESDLAVYTNTGRYHGIWLTGTDEPIRIRGHRGTISRLYDDGVEFGREILWEERPGVWIEVVSSTPRGLGRRELKRVAKSVRVVRPGFWRRLVVGTSPPPDVSELPHGRSFRIVMRGRARGHAWVLRALIPRGYPLGWYDLRSPCSQLSYRGTRTYGLNCDDPANWEPVKGQVFVFGVLRGAVKRVRIRDYYDRHDRGRVFRKRTIRLLREFSFYAAPLPRATCDVIVGDADHGEAGEFAGSGPVPRHPREAKRCWKLHPGGR